MMDPKTSNMNAAHFEAKSEESSVSLGQQEASKYSKIIMHYESKSSDSHELPNLQNEALCDVDLVASRECGTVPDRTDHVSQALEDSLQTQTQASSLPSDSSGLIIVNTTQGAQMFLLPMIASAVLMPVPGTAITSAAMVSEDIKPSGRLRSRHEGSDTELTTVNSAYNHQCKWLVCSETFPSLQKLVNHINDVHIKIDCFEEMYVCQWLDCPRKGKGFNARYKVMVHVRTHTNEKPHTCYICGKSFSRPENLKIHTRTHTGEKPYTCPYDGCTKAYSNSSDRFKHVLTHRKERPYSCKAPHCTKSYTDPSSLRKHMRVHGHHKPESQDVIEDPLPCVDLSESTVAVDLSGSQTSSPESCFLSTSSPQLPVYGVSNASPEVSDRLLANPLLSSATTVNALPGSAETVSNIDGCKAEHTPESCDVPDISAVVVMVEPPGTAQGCLSPGTSPEGVDTTANSLVLESPTPHLSPEICGGAT